MVLLSAIAIPALATPSQDQAAQQTQALIAQHNKFGKARGLDKAHQLERLVELAEQRYALLSELMASDPAQLFRVAIPEERRAGMPDEVQRLLLQTVELEGELESLYEDYDDGRHRLRHFLNTPAGERLEMHLAGGGIQYPSDTPLRVQGLRLTGVEAPAASDGDLVVESSGDNIEILACCESTGTSTSSAGYTPELANTFGGKSALVMLVNFRDAPSDKPWTQAQVDQVIFEDINAYFLEASYGQAWISGTVVDWTTVDQDSTICQVGDLATMANNAATASGYDPSAYDRLVYVFPKNTCGFSGSAYIGGNISWINGTLDNRVIAHELAHNLGLYHSESLECGSEVASGNCATIYYGDILDTMGTGNNAHFNAFQKERLGWLPPEDIVEVVAGGAYQLKPYETAPDGSAMALKVLRSIDATTGQKNWFYLEYRQPIGFDDNLASIDSANVYNGVVLHAATEGSVSSSRLLDANPSSDSRGNYFDWLDPALAAGASFSESASGVTISTEWADSNGAEVLVAVDPSACVTAAPTLFLADPATSPWVNAGTAVSYSFTLTNNDSVNCPSAGFTLSATSPSGWTTQFDASVLTLAPGESGSATLAVTSPLSAADGYYDIEVSADNGSYSSGGTATYVVSNPAQNGVPVANDDSAATTVDTAVAIDVLANDSDPDGDVLSISSLSGGNGTATIATGNTVNFIPAAGFTGVTSLTYSISDGNGGSDSAAVNVTVISAVQNSAPLAGDDSAETSVDTAVAVNVLANDSDPDGDTLSISGFSQGSKGSVSVNSDGTLLYTPARKFKTSDSFTYTVTDGSLTATATVTVSLASGGGNDSTGGGSGGKGNKR